MDKKEKEFTPKAINLCGKRRMLSSIKDRKLFIITITLKV